MNVFRAPLFGGWDIFRFLLSQSFPGESRFSRILSSKSFFPVVRGTPPCFEVAGFLPMLPVLLQLDFFFLSYRCLSQEVFLSFLKFFPPLPLDPRVGFF